MPIVDVNGTRLHVHVKGTGIPIVFIHPPLLGQSVFAYQKAQLPDLFKVILFDIRGHGKSAPSETPITYPLIAEDLVQLLDKLGVEKAFVAGYSSGGSVALEALLRYPSRFHGGILISAMSEVSDWQLKSRIYVGTKLAGWEAKRLLSWAIARGNADQSATFANMYKYAVQDHMKNAMQYFRCSLRYSCTSRLHEIRHPMLLLYGEDDRLFHRYAQILRCGLPNSSLLYLKGTKHQIPTKAASRMNGLIQCWITQRLGIEQPGGKQETAPGCMPDEYAAAAFDTGQCFQDGENRLHDT
ncbi:alpha/beta fold hydrolase [Paenibacillus sp. MBLB4367]|uniref:alpha/beta fold hydrolase n=1 Tax=Paenibacillus sp. MBLB4367 TaxID=3384767 RepID=UPI00390813A4